MNKFDRWWLLREKDMALFRSSIQRMFGEKLAWMKSKELKADSPEELMHDLGHLSVVEKQTDTCTESFK